MMRISFMPASYFENTDGVVVTSFFSDKPMEYKILPKPQEFPAIMSLETTREHPELYRMVVETSMESGGRLLQCSLSHCYIDSMAIINELSGCEQVYLGEGCIVSESLMPLQRVKTLLLFRSILIDNRIPVVEEMGIHLKHAVRMFPLDLAPNTLYLESSKAGLDLSLPHVQQCLGKLSLSSLRYDNLDDLSITNLQCTDLSLDLDEDIVLVKPVQVYSHPNLQILRLNWMVAGHLSDFSELQELYAYKTVIESLLDSDLSVIAPRLKVFHCCTDDLRMDIDDISFKITGHQTLQTLVLDCPGSTITVADNPNLLQVSVSDRTDLVLGCNESLHTLEVVRSDECDTDYLDLERIKAGSYQGKTAIVETRLMTHTLRFEGFSDWTDHPKLMDDHLRVRSYFM